jgi:hypothetical protein
MYAKALLCFIPLWSVVGDLKAQIFENVAAIHGIHHSLNSTDNWGSGVSFFDFDDDGWDDLTLLLENDSIVFYKNNQLLPVFSI